MITNVAHSAICVPDIDAAVQWYSDVLGFRVLSPPYRMEGAAIERDMGELVPSPVVVVAAIVGFGDDDRVVELVEYPSTAIAANDDATILRHGPTHVGLMCDDVERTRSELEAKGVAFLTTGMADIAGLRTTWFRDPWNTVFILMEKGRDTTRPYWRQFP